MESRTGVTEVLVPLRWSDMDAYGHVNNTQFIRLLEQARVTVLPAWLPSGAAMLDRGVVVARHEIEYWRPLDYRPEPVAIDLWVTAIGGASYELGYLVRDPIGVGAGLEYAAALTSMALFDFASQSPRRLSEQERTVLSSHVAPPPPLRRKAGRS